MYWHKQPFIMLMDSVGQTLRQGRAEMACLGSVMYEALCRKTPRLGWHRPKQCCPTELAVMGEMGHITLPTQLHVAVGLPKHG